MSTTKSNEWYTPAKYIEAARTVMGGIDLDPASCEVANQTVKAARYYDQTMNGLAQPWYGNVWCNPPYSSGGRGITGSQRGPRSLFIAKLIEEYQAGNVSQAILLTNTDTDASWFWPLWSYPICFARRKILFNRPGQRKEGHFFGVCFVYLGPNEARFIEAFSQFGTIAKRISTPPVELTMRELWEVTSE